MEVGRSADERPDKRFELPENLDPALRLLLITCTAALLSACAVNNGGQVIHDSATLPQQARDLSNLRALGAKELAHTLSDAVSYLDGEMVETLLPETLLPETLGLLRSPEFDAWVRMSEAEQVQFLIKGLQGRQTNDSNFVVSPKH